VLGKPPITSMRLEAIDKRIGKEDTCLYVVLYDFIEISNANSADPGSA
jgi:hypothetical protein